MYIRILNIINILVQNEIHSLTFFNTSMHSYYVILAFRFGFAKIALLID